MSKPKVTILQQRDGIIRRVFLDGREYAVSVAAPTVFNGQLAITLTLLDVELDSRIDTGEPAPDSGKKSR